MSSDSLPTMAARRDRSSRLPGFYRLDRAERLAALVEMGALSSRDADRIGRTGVGLPFTTADKMVENVIGCFELPLAIGTNLRVNGRDHLVPMVVEEPSVVAAVSHAAGIVRRSGGFEAEADRSVMTGQIQVVGLDDLDAAEAAVLAAREALVARANEAEPGMQRRGGGALDVEVRRVGGGRYCRMLVVHLLIDACDAMGANLVNTMCEAVAPHVERLTGGTVVLRILSNLTDRRRVRARCRIPVELLAWKSYSGETVAEGVVRASEFAEVDPWRAATHNKGIMNGIDAAAIAVGQDWRAIEAGAHAWAAQDGAYGPLARWWRDDDGALVGEIDVPMAVGTVGGPIRLHPTVKANLGVLDVSSASELAEVLGAVGLAQNLAAIKALGTTGIQQGHMALHARSVAATAGACGDEVERVASALVARGDVKVETAVRVLEELRA